jgi:DNA-binding MarR family transcriptional regulator
MTRQKSTDCDLACAPRDSVDALLQSWAERRPDLDFRPVGVITRLARVRAHLDAELEEVFAGSGLTGPSFAALVTLARITGEHGVSQRRLAGELGLTPGTVSVRVDRLVEQGLALRTPDPDSQRNTLVALTSQGRALFERVAPAHLDNGQRLLAALTEPEQQLLADLLRKLLAEFEGSRPAAAGEGRLGLVVTPAHVTMQMRSAVGLPPAPGLLVRSVEPGLPALRRPARLHGQFPDLRRPPRQPDLPDQAHPAARRRRQPRRRRRPILWTPRTHAMTPASKARAGTARTSTQNPAQRGMT